MRRAPTVGRCNLKGEPMLNQRWRRRRHKLRPSDPINPDDYGVGPISTRDAKAFVVEHHYSGTYPADRARAGLFRGRHLVGVAVFSVPAQARVIPSRTGLDQREGVELGRFVLLDDVPGNGESWFLARAFEVLRAELPKVRAVVSYSDPVERRRDDGRIIKPGHVGTIYQAHNAIYQGRASRRVLVLDGAGRVVSGRALSKLRNGERGEGHVYDRLRAAGAPKRMPMESGAAYVARALSEGPFNRLSHPGNHAYVWGLDRAMTRSLGAGMRYPKNSQLTLGIGG